MSKAFSDSMDVWYQLESKLHLPRNDVGGAWLLSVGNYMVMTGKEVSDEDFAVVVEQLRRQPSLRATLGAQSPSALRNLARTKRNDRHLHGAGLEVAANQAATAGP
jgi:hypothetical protein